MDKFKPDHNVDEQKRKSKFVEKIGSTIISLIFVYLFWYWAQKVEKNNECYVISGSNVPVAAGTADSYNVNQKFQVMFNLYAWATILDAVREFLAALFFKFQLLFLVVPICLLNLNGFVQFAAMIINHVYRLDHGGKVCSGDYLTSEAKQFEEVNGTTYMISRGYFLWVLLVIYWVIFALVCCGFTLAVVTISKLRNQSSH
jgi:hypothetical protein